MDYALHHDFSEIDAEQWNQLLKESVTDVPFLRHEYQRAWWSQRGGGEWPAAKLVLISAREDGRLIGIAALFTADYDGQRALLLSGSIEISDYLDVIVRPVDHARFISGLLDFATANVTDDWRGLDWYNIPDTSPTLAALKAEAVNRNWNYQEEVYRPTPRIALEGDFDAYLERLDKKQRHEVRRKMRRAADSGRGVRWYISDLKDVEADVGRLFQLMDGDENKAKFLREPMRTQMREIVRAARAGGWLWLAFLEAEGKPIAAALNFDYNGKLWGYNAGVDRAYMELSPGWLLLTDILEWACLNGRYEFDFMRGDEEYKYRLGGVNKYVMRARMTRS